MSVERISNKSFSEHLEVIQKLQLNQDAISDVAELCIESIKNGGRILFCGNGGSAADSQHLAAELTGRFLIDRRALPALALTVNTSSVTAIGNDFGFEFIFSREVEANGTDGDVLVAISTSGNSENIINAAKKAISKKIKVVGFTGANGGELANYCDICICIPSDSTPRIQECHILAGHIICEAIEAELC